MNDLLKSKLFRKPIFVVFLPIISMTSHSARSHSGEIKFRFFIFGKFAIVQLTIDNFAFAYSRREQLKNKVCCQGDPRWSSGLSLQILRSWMRKDVGSNPGDDLYRVSFSFADTSIEKRRLLRETNWNDNNAMKTKQEVV